MPTALCVTFPLLLAAVLIVSGVGKLRAPERAREAFTAMGVPSWLNRRSVVRAHPWAEIALGAALVALPGPFALVAASAVVLLTLVYVALVVRALRSPVDVDCACFGSLGSDRVTALTVWRNVWLAAMAVVTLGCSLEGRSVVARLTSLSPGEAWWLTAVASGVVTAVLVVGSGPGDSAASGGSLVDEEDAQDYIRTPTPAVPIELGDGSMTHLRALSRYRAQLLLFVSESCGGCGEVIEAVEGWRRELPQLDVRLVTRLSAGESPLASDAEPMSLHDPGGLVRQSLGVEGWPSAVMLGIDGLLAGGPVMGTAAVRTLVDEVRGQLVEAASESSP